MMILWCCAAVVSRLAKKDLMAMLRLTWYATLVILPVCQCLLSFGSLKYWSSCILLISLLSAMTLELAS